ncbi:MAG: helix-turn-helix transcriptional regulator [Planctomycetota bacterium]|jgi:predicted DNA-binding transcriptional regulator AlpA
MTEHKTQTAVSCRQLAQMLSLSARTIWRLRSAGRLPQPVTIGGSKRWLTKDIELFIDCNCDMDQFNLRKGGE